MDYFIIIIIALGASMLTFFSGFGLGTILTPAFILFFPPEIAVAATALVHLLNNIFKLALVGKHAVFNIILRFGIPSMIGAYLGAALLAKLSLMQGNWQITIIPGQPANMISFIIGLMIIGFSLFEIVPALTRLQFGRALLIPGGIVSGFFGGLSGHQGALRSAFLIKVNLAKEQFVATGIAIACMVDMVRIGTYATSFDFAAMEETIPYMIAATGAAFAGALLGKKFLYKLTFKALQLIVGVMMMAIGLLMVFGII